MRELNNKDITFRIYTVNDEIRSYISDLEILYVLKGRATINYAKENEIYDIDKNDIFVVNPFEMHRIVMEKDCRILSLTISSSLLSVLIPNSEYIHFNCKSFLFEDNNQKTFDIIRMDLSRIFSEFDKMKDEQCIGIRCNAAELILDLVKFFAEKSEELRSQVSSVDRISNVIKYIERHYSENINLSEIAKNTFLTTNYLSHLFKRELGVTFTTYLTGVRLQHAVMILEKNESVTNTAVITGFSSANAFIKAFKDSYGITPGQFQKQKSLLNLTGYSAKQNIYDDNTHLFDKLYSYSAKTLDRNVVKKNAKICQVSVDAGCRNEMLHHNWHFCINGGYAKEILLGNVQSAISKAQQEIGFSYIRVKGIFDNDISFCNRQQSGELTYNYVYIDELIDFILSVNAMPWIELSYMPSAIASKMQKAYTNGNVLSYPQKIEEWEKTISELINHLKARYGDSDVEKWIFTPFADMAFIINNYVSVEEYFEIFDASVKVLKESLPEVQLAVGTSYNDVYNLEKKLISHCKEKDIHVDLWITLLYSCIYPNKDDQLNLMVVDQTFPLAVSPDEDFVKHEFNRIRSMLKENGQETVEIAASEWNSNIWQRDLCNDTCYKSCYLVKNILENYDEVKGISYWRVSDQSDELIPSADIFHGGFGLVTRNGIPKAAYRAMQLLCRMGSFLLKKGKGYFITSDKDTIQIYLYNYCHYDTLYRYRHTSNISSKSRYNVFQNNEDIQFNIKIDGLKKGKYVKKVYSINRESGSAYDTWVKIGAPLQLSREEIDILMNRTDPSYYTEEVDAGDDCCIISEVEPHEVKLIVLSYQK